jgi:hypothetical protein
MKIERGKTYSGPGFLHRRVDDIVEPDGHSVHVFFTWTAYGKFHGRGNCTLKYFERWAWKEVGGSR